MVAKNRPLVARREQLPLLLEPRVSIPEQSVSRA